MWKTLFRNNYTYIILSLFLFETLWFVRILSFNLTDTEEAYFFNWTYGFIAITGALIGIEISIKKWGGWKSLIGRALILLPVGLLSQAFGVQIWFYYNVITRQNVPYPSLADFGFFGLIPAYAYGSYLLAKAAGGRFSLQNTNSRILAVVIPAIALVLSYVLFLKNIGFDLSHPIKLFLDVGYPLGEIVPVSIALFMLTLTRNLLGGKMKKRIIFLVAAFFFQFLTEYVFLYTAGAGTYVNGGINDYMYATSYTIMSLALITFSDYK